MLRREERLHRPYPGTRRQSVASDRAASTEESLCKGGIVVMDQQSAVIHHAASALCPVPSVPRSVNLLSAAALYCTLIL